MHMANSIRTTTNYPVTMLLLCKPTNQERVKLAHVCDEMNCKHLILKHLLKSLQELRLRAKERLV